MGFGVNAVLAALKIATGIIGRSSAMVADGVHSLSDFVTDIIVIVMIGVSRRKANKTYQYGYGKYETMATLLIGGALAIVAIGLFTDGFGRIIDVVHGGTLERPGMIALWMALISIVSKVALPLHAKPGTAHQLGGRHCQRMAPPQRRLFVACHSRRHFRSHFSRAALENP